MNNAAASASLASQVRDLHSERWLQINQDKVTNKEIIVQGIEFHLNANQFAHLKAAKEQGTLLYFTPEVVREIRYYTLFNPVLTFSTFYQKELVFRSTIALDGEVLNQVRSDCLERQEWAIAIASVHHWLIQEVIAQVPLQYKRLGTRLAWFLAIVIVALSVIISLANFQVLNPLFWLLPLVAVWLLAEGIKRIIWLFLPLFRRWLLRQMLMGRWAKDSKSRRFVLDLLTR
ncbi:MAG: hypothetical protein SAJ12_07150 [Jaaginema sp. PMC 1079.18]|nr:hypothetical protein [Jaaginema sp. PMC 1080.18]MEC4850773.1 hypothetical protein [Jaaginema sp. PMC 1079.18]MEC4866999.1 hypothetical protein [Jaaginema sp. PMC 1078.18]